jgi:NTE family protein
MPNTTALVLSGGEALGTFQAGAYAALHRRGFRPGWIAGGSIGALAGAIIAGNAEEERVPKLHAFWSFVASMPDLGFLPVGGSLRRDFNIWSGLQSLLYGRPGLFRPRLPGLLSSIPGMPRDVGLFDLGPARENLPRFIDFDRLNRAEVRLSVAAVDIETGERVIFDNRTTAITPDHLLASCAIPVKFPPVRIGERLLADAGLATNLPVDVVFAEPTDDLLCIAIDLFSPAGPAPDSLDGAVRRLQDLIFANQSRASLRLLELEFALRQQRDQLQSRSARILHIAYGGAGHESGLKTVDFSRSSLAGRWAAGERQAAAALDRLDQMPVAAPGLEIIQS